ncbi:hypothetical protein NX059_011630 [Plenodomus lindquistii]|nr:hypothetical protein NX059_011630 [Plenodomus lindquistii]
MAVHWFTDLSSILYTGWMPGKMHRRRAAAEGGGGRGAASEELCTMFTPLRSKTAQDCARLRRTAQDYAGLRRTPQQKQYSGVVCVWASMSWSVDGWCRALLILRLEYPRNAPPQHQGSRRPGQTAVKLDQEPLGRSAGVALLDWSSDATNGEVSLQVEWEKCHTSPRLRCQVCRGASGVRSWLVSQRAGRNSRAGKRACLEYWNSTGQAHGASCSLSLPQLWSPQLQRCTV